MKKVKWEKIKDQTYWGHESVENEGFVHCLPLNTYGEFFLTSRMRKMSW